MSGWRMGAWMQGLRQRSVRVARQMARRCAMPLLLISMLASGTLGQLAQAGFGAQLPVARAAGLNAASKPNHFNLRADTTSQTHQGSGHPKPMPGGSSGPTSPNVVRGLSFSMQPGAVNISPDAPIHFVGSDGRLEVQVPAGAVTDADIASAGGSLTLRITQVAPGSGSNAGGSGIVSFGMYLLQVVDAHDVAAATGLRQPVTLILHLGMHDSGGDVEHAYAVFNNPLPVGITRALTQAEAHGGATQGGATGGAQQPGRLGATTGPEPPTATPPTAAVFGPYSTQHATLDSFRHTLSANVQMSVASATASFDTESPIATFGRPDPFSVDLNVGGLTASYPIDTPAGPGGLTPPVSLTYSSASVSAQHNPQSAAPWVGEGWNLGLGSISWAEHDVAVNCNPSCSDTWESSWQLSDPFGTSVELLPPNIGVSSYFDDSPNYPCGWPGATTTCPVVWHTAPETHAKVIMYRGTIVPPDGSGLVAPCFRVFLPNGIMEEFGCTSDSLQYYYGGNGRGDYIANWYLDLITDPRGNQIHITYQQDQETTTSGHQYIRDVVPSSITWDDPTCQNAQTACSSWTPLLRVYFIATHTVAHPASFSCNPNGNLRCDDPADLSGSGGLANPQAQSTFVLNDIQTEVRSSGTDSWHILREYLLGYEQTPAGQAADPVTGLQIGVTGHLLLRRLQVLGTDNNTATGLPPVNFSYSVENEYYVDSSRSPSSAAGCGPSWNNTHCYLWSQSWGGNAYYLTATSNGLGETDYFTWANAHNNTHGAVANSNSHANEPLYCNTNESATPCNKADDQAYSRIVLTQKETDVCRAPTQSSTCDTSTKVQTITTYKYFLTTFSGNSQLCSDCIASMYWGNQNDLDYLDYYNGHFMGFTQADVFNPDGSEDDHYYYATDGWGVYDTSQVSCGIQDPRFSPTPCKNAPWWGAGTVLHGREYEADYYEVDQTTLLGKTTTQYHESCPPTGISGTPQAGWGTWDGNLVSELDHNNPVADCEVHVSQVTDTTSDGASSSATSTTTYTYDIPGNPSYDTSGLVTKSQVTSNGGSPGTLVSTTGYVWNDHITYLGSSGYADGIPVGPYLLGLPAYQDSEDSSGAKYACSFTSYDYLGYMTGSQPGVLPHGEATITDVPTAASGCAGSPPSSTPTGGGWIETRAIYDSYGNPDATHDPDADNGVWNHNGCTVPGGSTTYTICATYDGTYHMLPVSGADAKTYTTSITYGSGGTGGWGLWPVSSTDPNTQTTSATYDTLGRVTSTTLPGETAGMTTTSTTYTDWCAVPTPTGSVDGPEAPCVEIDTTQRLDGNNAGDTVTTRSFYDGAGHLVETRSPAPSGVDVIVYASYDPAGRIVAQSQPYYVTSYTGAPGAAAYAVPDSTKLATTYSYPTLRETDVTDPMGNITKTTATVTCMIVGSHGTNCYEQTNVVDANGHQASTYVDALGRLGVTQRYTGNSTATYALYSTTQYWYDQNGNLAQIVHPDGTSLTSFSYDAAGRQVGMVDPDQGTESYGYDNNGNLTSAIDARGACPATPTSPCGSVYVSYDQLNRPLTRSIHSDNSSPYVTYTYDVSGYGSSIGRLTNESFSGLTSLGAANGLTGAYAYTYDGRGQVTKLQQTITGGAYYNFYPNYNDAGQTNSLTFPDGESLNYGYSPQGWLTSAGLSTGATLAAGIQYNGTSGPAGLPSYANVAGSTITYSATYDNDLRLSSLQYTNSFAHSLLFSSARTYDAVGNVSSVTTGLPAGTDTQAFCYDEQDRLTWAGTAGTPTCTPAATPSTTLSGASYTFTYGYDTLDRITHGSLGAYTDGPGAQASTNPAPLHAVLAAGTNGSGGPYYTASYDAAGNMTCRAPSYLTTCASGSTPTGQQLGYDAEGRLTSWQNAPSSPSTTISYLYDGEGHRVEQQAVTSSATTRTYYLAGGLYEISTNGSTATATTYYPVPGVVTGINVGGTLSYLAGDGLGTVSAAMSSGGALTASQLYGPYGTFRYSSGTMPTARGFTGQYSDAVTGLDYYGARYYDPAVGQFAQADSVLDGLNRYSYVHDNPTTATDPSGHMLDVEDPAALPGADPSETNDGSPEGVSGGGGGGLGPFLVTLAKWALVLMFPIATLAAITYDSAKLIITSGQTASATTNLSAVYSATPDIMARNLPGRLAYAEMMAGGQAGVGNDHADIEKAMQEHQHPTPTPGPPPPPQTQPGGGGMGSGVGDPPTGGTGCGCPPDGGGGSSGGSGGASGVDPNDPSAFIITDWSGYPTAGGVPQPEGPFKILEGQEYANARDAGNAAAAKVRRLTGLTGHHIQPVKFGGAPTDPNNLIPIESPWPHQYYTNWWSALQREVQGGDYHRIEFLC